MTRSTGRGFSQSSSAALAGGPGLVLVDQHHHPEVEHVERGDGVQVADG